MNNIVNKSYAETAVRFPERRAMKFTVLPLTGHVGHGGKVTE